MLNLAMNVAVATAILIGLAAMRRLSESAEAKRRSEDGERFQEFIDKKAAEAPGEARFYRKPAAGGSAAASAVDDAPATDARLRPRPGRAPSAATLQTAGVRVGREAALASTYPAHRRPPQLRVTATE
jgi:hypothetical protein